MHLPTPDPAAAEQSRLLGTLIRDEIRQAGGWMSFARYMDLALYAPQLGYYSGGTRKFGAEGDFVTAPEISPLFGQCLGETVLQIMAASRAEILEVGAGSGALAASLLAEMAWRGALPERYAILDLSGELRARQAETLAIRVPDLAGRVVWLDALPKSFSGAVVANELLDALPVQVVAWREEGIFERGAALDARGDPVWAEQPAAGPVLRAAEAIPVARPFISEVGLAAQAWTATWGGILDRGALLLVDYGFPRHELYHPQRCEGTLMCHYRHYAHADPFWLPGLNDITAHIDFTAIAEAGHDAGLDLLGYTGQGQFLLNAGITERLARCPASDALRHAALASGAQKLISPAEMGELFKVIALGKGIAAPLRGFERGDRSHTL